MDVFPWCNVGHKNFYDILLMSFTYQTKWCVMLMHCLDDTESWFYYTSAFQILSMIALSVTDYRHTNGIISSLHGNRKWTFEGIDIETRPILTEHNIFEADIFNPDNNLDDLRSTSTHSPKIPFLINPQCSLHGLMLSLRHLLIWMSRIVHSKSHNLWVITSYQLTTSHTHCKHGLKHTHQEVPNVKFIKYSPTKCSQTYTHLFQRQQHTLSYMFGQKFPILDALYSTYDLWKKIMFIFSCGYRIFKPIPRK